MMTMTMVTKMKVVKNKVRTCTEIYFLLICESLRIYLFIYLFIFILGYPKSDLGHCQ